MQTNKWFSFTEFCFDCELSLFGCSKSLPGSYFCISDLNPWPLVTSVFLFFVLCFRLKLHPHNGFYHNSSLIKFQYLVPQISQPYQSLSPHLLPYPQDTPKTVQDRQQQEQLKINTGFFIKNNHGEVFIYNNSYSNLKFGPFFWHKLFWNLQFAISWSPLFEWSLAEQWVLKTDLTPAQPTPLSFSSHLFLTKWRIVLILTLHLVILISKHIKNSLYFSLS
jgi:hypothetical protein